MLRSAASSMAAHALLRRFASSSSRATLLPVLLHRPTITSPSPPLPLSLFAPLPQFVAGNIRNYARGGSTVVKEEKDDDDNDDDDDDEDDEEFDDDEFDEMVGSDYSGSEVGESGDEDLSD